MQAGDDRIRQTGPSPMTTWLKRGLDVVASVAGLVLLSPLLVLIAIVIKVDSPGPVLFRQVRVGQGGHAFRIYKFRSMVTGAARIGTALTARADARITRAGRVLRNTKLDELPQLINVLRGEMSIVGPRPEVPEFMNFYTAKQRATILAMRPGMTDYAAILFRDESALLDQGTDPIEVYRRQIIPIKFACYERYRRDIGVWNDLRIVAATISLLATGAVPRWLGIEHRLAMPIASGGSEV